MPTDSIEDILVQEIVQMLKPEPYTAQVRIATRVMIETVKAARAAGQGEAVIEMLNEAMTIAAKARGH